MYRREEQLRVHILSQYKSVRAFAQAIGIPYSTVDTMLKKGVDKTGFATVAKICKNLHISLSSLLPKEPGMPAQRLPEGISMEEYILLNQYRSLDEYGKLAVNSLLSVEAKRVRKQTAAYQETLPVAARGKENSEKRLTIRKDFSLEELEGEESEF